MFLAFLGSLWWLGMESLSICCASGLGHAFAPLISEGLLSHGLSVSVETEGGPAWKLQMPSPNLGVN